MAPTPEPPPPIPIPTSSGSPVPVSSLPPDLTVHVITDEPSRIATYGPVIAATAALLAAVIAFVGVVVSNRKAAQRQRADLAAAVSRERTRHRREFLVEKVGELLAAALDVVPSAIELSGWQRRLPANLKGANRADVERWHKELDGLDKSCRRAVDRVASRVYQIELVGLSEATVEEFHKVMRASVALGLSAHLELQTDTERAAIVAEMDSQLPPGGLPSMGDGSEALRAAVKSARDAFHREYDEMPPSKGLGEWS